MVGGGMRQSGHLAAAGIIALNDLTKRLEEDHSNAQKLAQGIARLKGIVLKPELIKTNIIFFRLEYSNIKPESFLKSLESEGIKILMIQEGIFRIVLHREISETQVEQVIKAITDLTK
jgi:threonine aldolase